MVNIAAISEAF